MEARWAEELEQLRRTQRLEFLALLHELFHSRPGSYSYTHPELDLSSSRSFDDDSFDLDASCVLVASKCRTYTVSLPNYTICSCAVSIMKH